MILPVLNGMRACRSFLWPSDLARDPCSGCACKKFTASIDDRGRIGNNQYLLQDIAYGEMDQP